MWIASPAGMRSPSWIFLVVLSGCFSVSEQSCQFNSDPCPGHGQTQWLIQESDCSCPLVSEIGPKLEGKACSPEGIYCTKGSFLRDDSCRCEGGFWSCLPRDLSVPEDLAGEDLSESEDLSEMD